MRADRRTGKARARTGHIWVRIDRCNRVAELLSRAGCKVKSCSVSRHPYWSSVIVIECPDQSIGGPDGITLSGAKRMAEIVCGVARVSISAVKVEWRMP